MKKVLIVSLNSCYPLNHGGALAQYYFLDGLKDRIQFVLCTEVHNLKELQNLETLEKKLPSLKIYFTNKIQPAPQKNFIGQLKLLLRNFEKLVSSKKNANFTGDLNADDFNDPYFWHVDNSHSNEFVALINEVIQKESIKQVQFDFYNTLDLCFAIPQGIRKIFVPHEIRFKRLKQASDKSPLSEDYKRYLIKKTELFERYCLRAMDKVVVFNEDDAYLLGSDAKSIKVSPFGIPDELIFRAKGSDTFSRFLFVGGEGHTPNKLGLIWFLDEIYLPNKYRINIPLWVVGDWSAAIKNKYKDYSQIIFCGVVDSIKPFFEESIFVNAILTGSGLRTKVLHAFVNKVPVLSTRFGAEGCFDNKNNRHIGFFDDAKEFLQILKESDLRELAKNGYEFYNQLFNREILLNVRNNILISD
jgi:hypothetical protein